MLKKKLVLKKLKKYLVTLFLSVVFHQSSLLAQPYWVINNSIENHEQYYFGIGSSDISEKAADEEAYVRFGKMIEIKVKSTTEILLEENKSGITDIIVNKTQIESDVKLRGITITERFYDEDNNTFFSLIKYEVSSYEKILKRELNSEIEIQIEEHKNEEKHKLENVRHSEEISKIEEAELISRLENEQREINLKLKEEKQKLENEKFMRDYYKSFYDKTVNPYLIDVQNAEVGANNHQLSIKPTLTPLSFIQANYSYYTKYMGFSLGFYWKNKRMEEQDFQIKLRVFKENFGIYPITLALGVVQYSYNISDFSNIEEAKWGVSPSLMMNVSFPQFSNVTSLYIDSRKMSLGLLYYPFFEYFDGKIGIILQSDIIFNPNFQNCFGDNLILQAGLKFEVIKNGLLLLISYEDNEFIAVGFDFEF